MAATCDICGKGPSFGNNVSHSEVKTRRRWNPNIQRVRTMVVAQLSVRTFAPHALRLGKSLANFLREIIENGARSLALFSSLSQ